MNYFMYTYILVILISSIGSHCQYQKRVIGGEIAPPDKYRWAVSIKGNVDSLRISSLCGASILKTPGKVYWLLTAAHCFFSSNRRKNYDLTNPELWHARVGLIKVDFYYQKHGIKDKIKDKLKNFFNKAYRKLFGKDKFTTVISDLHVQKIIIHPKYKPMMTLDKSKFLNLSSIKLDDDIALMKLKEPLPIELLSGVSTIDLPDPSLNTSWPPIGADCIVVGWGCIKVKKAPSSVAKLAILKVWENKDCQEIIPSLMNLNPISDFCAGYLKKKYGLCHGDSGSGLICEHNGIPTIAGIVSRAHGLDPGEYPAAFTRVSSYTNWILKNVWEN